MQLKAMQDHGLLRYIITTPCMYCRTVAKLIIESEQWEDALRNTTISSENDETTVFRKLIRKMPGY